MSSGYKKPKLEDPAPIQIVQDIAEPIAEVAEMLPLSVEPALIPEMLIEAPPLPQLPPRMWRVRPRG